MKKTVICFTAQGKAVVDKLNTAAVVASVDPAEEYSDLDTFVREGFTEGHAMIFVGATGIAVRAISPYVKDKLSDSPVIVIDDNAQFVIPILSGHAGGANKLAVTVADLINAVPVITTSTDVNSAFSADVFAIENHLKIRNRDGIKKVSAKAIEGKPVTISVKDYPPKDAVDIIVADETDREYSLLLSPKRYVVGIGMKKGKDTSEAEQFVMSTLRDNNIDISDVYAFATIDVKEDEAALIHLRDKYRIPLITFEAAVLSRTEGDFSSSQFVKDTVGVDNVCERAASLAAGPHATMILPKTCGEGITIAISKHI